MSLTCENCGAEVLEIDVKCTECGHPQTSTSAYRMVGNVLLGQYRIVDVLGQGGMSVVYKGRHRLTDQEVALKLLPPELAALAQVKSRFVEEAKALAQLDHPNIVHLYNFGEENGCFVLAMQYVHGQTFERMIMDAQVLEWSAASRIALDVLRALEYAHGRGIIHRDMKPSNILVREHDGSATVMDFGIAKMTTSTRLTATGQTMGTVRYMSPEQVRGLPVDGRTDIYSLGATIYEAVCGDTPFDGDTHFEIMTKHLHEPPPPPSQRGIKLPAAFEAMLLCSLAKNPDDRFQTVREFRKELEGILRDNHVAWAETMRLSRDDIAGDARGKKPGDGQAGAVPVAIESGNSSSARAPASRPISQIMTEPLGAVQSGASRERSAGHVKEIKELGGEDVSAPVQAPALAEALDVAERPSGRPGTWIALAGVVVVAAAGVVLYLTRTSSSAGREPAAGPVKAQVHDAEPRWPQAFAPPGVEFGVDRTFADEELRVLAPAGWDADRIRRAHRDGHALFEELLQTNQLADKVPIQPITIAVVPARVFCDPRVYERGKVPDNCAEAGVHYRPRERTLFVGDDQDYLEVNIAYGNAIAVCLHSQIQGCDDMIGRIDREFETRKGRQKTGGK